MNRLHVGSLSKLRFKMEDLLARLVPGLEGQRNLASALSALPSRASSQVRPNNAGTAFSKPGQSPVLFLNFCLENMAGLATKANKTLKLTNRIVFQ